MITDALLQLSNAQAVTASAFSTNIIDLGSLGGDPGREGMEVDITVDQTVTAAGAATVTFQLVASTSANLSAPNVLTSSDAIGKAELTAGRKAIRLRASPHLLASLPFGQRYLGVQYTVATGPLTAGQFTANVVREGQTFGAHYPQNRTIY